MNETNTMGLLHVCLSRCLCIRQLSPATWRFFFTMNTQTQIHTREGDLFPISAYPGAILCLIILPYLCRQILGPTQAFNGLLCMGAFPWDPCDHGPRGGRERERERERERLIPPSFLNAMHTIPSLLPPKPVSKIYSRTQQPN